MSDLMFDVDQAGELKAAFRRAGWTNQEINRLCEDDTLARVRMVLFDHTVITVPDYLLDLDVTRPISIAAMTTRSKMWRRISLSRNRFSRFSEKVEWWGTASLRSSRQNHLSEMEPHLLA
jgi:hypothetical protein